MELPVILIIVLIAVVVWRGPKTLPLIGRAFGQGVKEARKEIDGMKEDIAGEKPAATVVTVATPPPPPPVQPPPAEPVQAAVPPAEPVQAAVPPAQPPAQPPA